MTLLTILVFVLLGIGIIGSIYPRVPGPLLSLAGVYLYWWSTEFTEPTTVLVLVLTVLGALTLFGSLFEQFISTRLGGASPVSATIAGIIGLLSFTFLGPIGVLLVTALVLFLLEYRRQHDMKAGVTAALSVVLGTVASRLIKLLLTILIFVIMIVVIVL